MNDIRITSNYGADWTKAVKPDGTLRDAPIYMVDRDGDSIALEPADIDLLIDARADLLAAQKAVIDKLDAALPQSPGLYVHPRYADHPLTALLILERNVKDEWFEHSTGGGVLVRPVKRTNAEVREWMHQWGGLAQLTVGGKSA